MFELGTGVIAFIDRLEHPYARGCRKNSRFERGNDFLHFRQCKLVKRASVTVGVEERSKDIHTL